MSRKKYFYFQMCREIRILYNLRVLNLIFIQNNDYSNKRKHTPESEYTIDYSTTLHNTLQPLKHAHTLTTVS